jgi:integrase
MKGCRPLSEEEISQVTQAFDGPFALRNQALLVLDVRTGYRISELLSLRVGDVFQRGQVVDWITVPKRHMKGQTAGRTLPLHAEAKGALQRWLEAYGRQQPLLPTLVLFPSRKGVNRPLQRGQAHHILQEAYRTNGLTGMIGCHGMRKTFGQKVYEKTGRDLRATQHAMGHKSPASTAAYLAVDEQAIDAIILAL